jgi:glutathione synthase
MVTVALQMDPIGSVNIRADSTFRLALEAQARGHRLFYYQVPDLVWRDGRLLATGHDLEVRPVEGDHAALGERRVQDLADVDVILLRQDPPFDMTYITNTHLLEMIHPKTLVVNDPFWVRNCPEKILVLEFRDLMPPTMVARSLAAIRDFRAEHGDIIVKPLFGNGGAGVFRVKPDDENLGALLEMFTLLYREPIIVQRYLPAVRAGDKRIILVDGEPAGAVLRVPAAGEARANLHAGARAVKAELTSRDREICAAIGPALRRQGLIFVGIDVIGDWLTEINVTSPTGLQEIHRLGGERIEIRIWDAIEARLHERADRRPT